jgi:hypothetical protein
LVAQARVARPCATWDRCCVSCSPSDSILLRWDDAIQAKAERDADACQDRALAAGRRIRWQNGYAERLIGSIRRECLDHVVVLGERHLRHLLLSYMKYHNEVRTHLSLEKDAPVSRAVERAGQILCRPILGGLHHQYVRI